MSMTLTGRIVATGLVAGTLDITAAIINYTIRGGTEPVRIFYFIASGVLGPAASSGGLPMAFLGLFFHFCIATIWTTFFFLAYPRLVILSRNWIASGIAYGFFVWMGMNLVVLPLSRTPAMPFNIGSSVTAALILVICIGLPIAFSARQYFRKLAART